MTGARLQLARLQSARLRLAGWTRAKSAASGSERGAQLPWAAAALAVLARALAASSREAMFNDGPRFVAIAEAFLRGDWRAALSDSFHPLTSLLMAGLAAATPLGLEAAGVLLNVLAGGVATLAVYALARERFGPWLAGGAALLVALHPQLIASSCALQSDGIYLAFFLFSVRAAWDALRSGRSAWALAAGASCGLAYLTRPEGLMVALVFSGWLGLEVLTRARPLRGAAALGLAFACALAVTSAPYVLALRAHTGSWTLTQKKSLGAMLGTDQLSHLLDTLSAPDPAAAAAAGDATSASAEAGAAKPPATAAALPAESAPLLGLTRALGEALRDGYRAFRPAFLLLLLFGLERGRPERSTLYLLAYVALLSATLLSLHFAVGYVSRRHWLSAVPLCTPFAARGALQIWRLAAPRLRVSAPPWAALALALLVVGSLVWSTDRSRGGAKSARREAAEWLGRAAQPAVVAGHRQRDAHYAGAPAFVSIHGIRDTDALRRAALDGQARHLLLDLGEYAAGPAELAKLGRELHRVEYQDAAVVVIELSP